MSVRASVEDSATLGTVAKRKADPKHPHKWSELGALRVCDPDQWELKIRDALKQAGNNATEAAAILGISRPQIFRWLKDPRFTDRPPQRPGPKKRP